MAVDQGPLHFNQALEWFRNTYGWSAEVRDYSKMQKWAMQTTQWMGSQRPQAIQVVSAKLPSCCNPHWSWTNGYDDLRIYVATDKEIGFFQLAHIQDQRGSD